MLVSPTSDKGGTSTAQRAVSAQCRTGGSVHQNGGHNALHSTTVYLAHLCFNQSHRMEGEGDKGGMGIQIMNGQICQE